jgi:hypothetical protein
MLWMYQRVFFGPLRRDENRGLPDLDGREWAVLLPLVALIPFIGIVPQPLLDRIEPAAQRLVERMEHRPPVQAENPPGTPPPGGAGIHQRPDMPRPSGPMRPAGPPRTFPPSLSPYLRPRPPERAP